jgi:type IV secretion system protein VirB5
LFGQTTKDRDDQPMSHEKSVDNPYIAHKTIQDDRYLNQAVAKHNWQTAFRITAALLAISMGFNGYYMTQSKFIPMVIATDKIGNLVVVGPADKASPIDDKRILRAEVLQWIENARIIVGDQFAQKHFIHRVYARIPSTGTAKTVLDDYYRDRNPFATAATQTVAAEVTLALPTSDNTWQVEWNETWRSLTGEIIRQERWKAVLTFELHPLTTEEGIRANPVGFFVTSFSWSKQI